MLVKVKDLKGVVHDIELSGDDNILQVKKKLHQLTGSPAEWCRLKFGDFELDDKQKINFYEGIEEGSTLTMIQILPW